MFRLVNTSNYDDEMFNESYASTVYIRSEISAMELCAALNMVNEDTRVFICVKPADYKLYSYDPT